MKKRNIAFVIIMSLITFGLYSLYWLYATRKEMVAKGYQIPSIWRTIIYPILGITAGAILSGVASANSSSNILSIVGAIILIVSGIASVVLWVRFISRYCRAVEKVTNGGLTYGFNLAMAILHWLFSFTGLWLAIVQYHFNKVGQAGGVAPPQPAEGQSAPVQPVQPTDTPAPQPHPIYPAYSPPAVPPQPAPQPPILPPQAEQPVQPPVEQQPPQQPPTISRF